MTEQQTTTDPLIFAQSDSQAQAIDWNRHGKFIERYAARIAGITRLSSDVMLGISRTGNPARVLAAALSFSSRFILIAFGVRKNGKYTGQEAGKSAPEENHLYGLQYFLDRTGRVFRPDIYPIESASGLGLLCGLSLIASGTIVKGRSGWMEGIIGSLITLGEGRVVYGKGGSKQEPLVFRDSRQQAVGMTGPLQRIGERIRDNPVAFSSALQGITALLTIAQGMVAKDLHVSLAGIGYMGGNIIMGSMVDRDAMHRTHPSSSGMQR